MKARSTIGLILLFVALFAGYAYVRISQTIAYRNTEQAKLLFTFKPTDIRGLTIEQVGQRAVRGERTASGWAITAPDASITASADVWERVTQALALLRAERTLEKAGEDLAAYGLVEPRLRVTAEKTDGGTLNVFFGKTDPTEACRYVRVDDGPVLLVPDVFFGELNRSLLELRERYLLPRYENGLTRIEYVRIRQTAASGESGAGVVVEESVPVELQREVGKPWTMLQPEPGPANQQTADTLARYLQFAAGLRYVDAPEHLSDYGLEPPAARIRVWSGETGPHTLLIGALERETKDGGLFVKRDDSAAVAVIDASFLEALPKSPTAFRERRLFTRGTDRLVRVSYEAGATTFTLEKDKEQGWRLADRSVQDSDQVAINAYVMYLTTLNIDGYVPQELPDHGLTSPTLQLTFSFDDGSASQVLLGGQSTDGLTTFARQDTGAVVTLSTAVAKNLFHDVFDFRGKTLLGFNPDQVTRLSMIIDNTDYVFELVDGVWRVRAPADRFWESASDMKALLQALSAVKAGAQELTKGTPDEVRKFSLETPAVIVRVTVQPPGGGAAQELGPLRIGAPAVDDPQQRYAAMQGVDGVYRVSQAVLGDVREALKGLIKR